MTGTPLLPGGLLFAARAPLGYTGADPGETVPGTNSDGR
jgi:hypothetical protein